MSLTVLDLKAREKAQWLRALAALGKDQFDSQSPHHVVHNTSGGPSASGLTHHHYHHHHYHIK